MFDYIEIFYNPTRKLVKNGRRSPAQFEQEILKAEGVQNLWGSSGTLLRFAEQFNGA